MGILMGGLWEDGDSPTWVSILPPPTTWASQLGQSLPTCLVVGTQGDPPLQPGRAQHKEDPLPPPWHPSLRSPAVIWDFATLCCNLSLLRASAQQVHLGLKCWFSAMNHLKHTPWLSPPVELPVFEENWNTWNIWVCLQELCTFLFQTCRILQIISFPIIHICPAQRSMIRMESDALWAMAGFADNQGRSSPKEKIQDIRRSQSQYL